MKGMRGDKGLPGPKGEQGHAGKINFNLYFFHFCLKTKTGHELGQQC